MSVFSREKDPVCVRNMNSLLAMIATCVFVSISGDAMAADWFVRPENGDYGSENGISYENAWDGFSSMEWNRIKGGDTLYVCGTHNIEGLTIKKDGELGNSIIIDGDCLDDPGVIHPKILVSGKWKEDERIGKGVYKIDLDLDPDVLIVDDMVLGKLNDKKYLRSKSSNGWSWFATDTNAEGTNYNRVSVNFWDGVEAFWGYDANGIQDPNKPLYIRFKNRNNPDDIDIYRNTSPFAVNTNGCRFITIRDLLYKNSRYGIYIDRSEYITLENLSSFGNYHAICLKNTQGNIQIKNSTHTGAYYGMQNRTYYPHFAYNKNASVLDRSIQTSSWACLWMKDRFSSQVFN